MELTQKTLRQRLEDVKVLSLNQDEEQVQLRTALHEKGVECSIIVPLLEVLLDFDSLRDIRYEQSSETHHVQRYDFLVRGEFLIEAKELGSNLDDHYRQVMKYIGDNDNINYGILTNGVDFQIWLQKSFIEGIAGCQLPHTPKVAKVLEVSLLTDETQFVLDALALFSKEHYVNSFRNIASITGYYASGSRGRPAILHNDRQMDEILRFRIRDAVVIQKGVYYDDIDSGALSAGDKLSFENSCINITVEVTKTGTVMLRNDGANIHNMVQAIKDGWGAMIPLIADKWSVSDTEFTDPLEIIKLALNKQRLYGKDNYVFKHVSDFIS